MYIFVGTLSRKLYAVSSIARAPTLLLHFLTVLPPSWMEHWASTFNCDKVWSLPKDQKGDVHVFWWCSPFNPSSTFFCRLVPKLFPSNCRLHSICVLFWALLYEHFFGVGGLVQVGWKYARSRRHHNSSISLSKHDYLWNWSHKVNLTTFFSKNNRNDVYVT